jgi:hypothetical protein
MIIYHAEGFLSMKNCIYFAGSGQFSGPRLVPGWGFTETGQPRFGSGTGDGVLLDDRWPPSREAIGRMAEALRGAPVVVCDFEKAPSPLLASLLARLEGQETVVPESCAALRRFYGDRLVPLYLTLDDGERLARALARERAQTHPKYAELCRRFLADEADHNPEALLAAGVTKTFDNTELDGCLAELKAYIRAQR